MLTDADIQKMADLIAERFQPEKIILFGSYANGTATEDSDVDLVVVTRDVRTDVRDQAARMQVAVWDFPVGKDILVRTPQQFEQACKIYWTVFSQANKNGKLLYAEAS